MSQPLRFGILILQTFPYQEQVERWKMVEALGFDSVWTADHYVDPYLPQALWFDGWSLLAAMAAVTSRIHIGTLVTSITLRNPAILAKQAMTVDHISDGRLILGIGAGRAPLDHSMTGTMTWEAAERARRFREFVELTHHVLTHAVTTYDGQYYRVKEAIMNPAPVQKPRPRLMLAAHGDSTLKLTARLADTWNTFLKFNATPDEALALAQEHNRKLDEYCTRAGRPPTTLSRSLLCGLTQDHLFASREAFRAYIGRYRATGIDEFMFYWTSEEPHPVFPNLHQTTIPNQATLEWVAEEIAALRTS